MEKIQTAELESGDWNPSWLPKLDHPSIAPEHVEVMSKVIVAGILLAVKEKAFETGDEWNRLLGDYEVTDVEGFLREAWRGKA